MKLHQTCAAGFLAAAMAGTAAAQTTIHISGSTAFRTSYAKAILDILDTANGHTITYAYDNSGSGTNFKASAAIYHGFLKSTGAEVYIKSLATGAAAGVIDVAQQNTLTKWIATPATVGGVIPGTAVTLTAGGTNINGLAYSKESSPTEIGMSDDDKSSVVKAVSTATTGGAVAAAAINAANLIDGGTPFTGAGTGAGDAGTVGVVMFVWDAGTQSGTPAYTNMTQQAAAALIKGPIPVSLLTGTNTTDYLFLIGRNEDSGTRIDCLAEAQSGFGNGCQQFMASFTGSTTSYVDNSQTIQTGGAASATLSGLTLWPGNWPVNTAPSITWSSAGHSGYIAGGDVGNVLKATGGQKLTLTGSAKPDAYVNGTSTAYLIGYVGSADYSAATGTKLTYNGVAQTIPNVQNGSYTLWAFEHLYYRPALTGVPKQTANDIADKIYTVDAPTNGNGVTDNTGAITDVAGCLYDASFKVSKSSGVAGNYLIPNGN